MDTGEPLEIREKEEISISQKSYFDQSADSSSEVEQNRNVNNIDIEAVSNEQILNIIENQSEEEKKRETSSSYISI